MNVETIRAFLVVCAVIMALVSFVFLVKSLWHRRLAKRLHKEMLESFRDLIG